MFVNGDLEAIEKFKPKLKANNIDYKKMMKKIEWEIREGNYDY